MSDQPKHTPGEWIAKHAEGGGFDEWYISRDGEARAIASDIIDPVTGLPCAANAHLIAAAPDLLNALKVLVALGSLELPHQRDTAINAALAAIAKAEGRDE